MARITVDDCLKRIPNRFDMTLVATIRARQLSVGGSPMVEPARDKPTVIALRELAQGKVGRGTPLRWSSLTHLERIFRKNIPEITCRLDISCRTLCENRLHEGLTF